MYEKFSLTATIFYYLEKMSWYPLTEPVKTEEINVDERINSEKIKKDWIGSNSNPIGSNRTT